MYDIVDFCVKVAEVGDRKATYEEFKSKLPFASCRFGVFDQDYTTADGRPASKLWFLTWVPDNATPANKMGFTSAKGKFADILPGVFDVLASSTEALDSHLGMGGEEDMGDDQEDFDF
jgi:hypothetical protein